MTTRSIACLVVAAVVSLGAHAQDNRRATEETLRDIQATLGVVPSFFRAYPEAGLPGAWASFKQVQVSEKTALAAISRHWSTVLNGAAIDMATFKGEVDTSLRVAAERAAKK